MSLTSRIHANQCAVMGCSRARAQDAKVCATCLADLWANRLDRQPDGSYTKRRTFTARDETGRLAA